MFTSSSPSLSLVFLALTPRHTYGENADRHYTQRARMRHGIYDKHTIKRRRPCKDSLQWEALADVLRGRVKLSIHFYEAHIMCNPFIICSLMIIIVWHWLGSRSRSDRPSVERSLIPSCIFPPWRRDIPRPSFLEDLGRCPTHRPRCCQHQKRGACGGFEFAPQILSAH